MAFPSTFVDLQNAVTRKARLDTADSTIVQAVKDWINQAYNRVCVEAEYVRGTGTASPSANATTISLPTGVTRLTAVRCLPSGGAYATPMRQVSLARLLALRAVNTSTGTPTHYTVTQSSIEIFPAAVGTETVQFWFSKAPTPLSGDTDVPVIDEPYASKLLEYGALIEAYDHMKDLMSGFTIRQEYDQWLGRFREHLARREGVGQQADPYRDANPPAPSTHMEIESPV